MVNYNFKKDILVAHRTEKEIALYLENRYGAKIISFENTNKYDIKAEIRNRTITFEVKEDFICKTTGNVGVEFKCRGKDSGISVSLADYYIYKLHTSSYGIQYVLHKTDVLKDMINNRLYSRIVNGGDKGSNSMNYLFKYDAFVKTGNILPLDKK